MPTLLTDAMRNALDEFQFVLDLELSNVLFVDLLIANTSDESILDVEDWEEIRYQVQVESSQERTWNTYPLLIPVDGCKYALAYRKSDAIAGAEGPYAVAAAKAGALLRSIPYLAELAVTDSDVHLWSYAVHKILGADQGAGYSLDVSWQGEADLTCHGQPRRTVKTYRQQLPSTAAQSSVFAIDLCLNLPPLKRGDNEWKICNGMNDGEIRSAKDIVPFCGTQKTHDGQLRGILSSLRKRGYLGYARKPGPKGYYLAFKGRLALAMSEKSQD